MARKNNRKCICCGKEYFYCSGNCQDNTRKESWYAIFHNQNCHDIYDAVANILPIQGKEAAKEALDKCDLSNKENFNHNIKRLINEVYDIVEEENKEEKAEGSLEVKTVEENKEDNKVEDDKTNNKVNNKIVVEPVKVSSMVVENKDIVSETVVEPVKVEVSEHIKENEANSDTEESVKKYFSKNNKRK